MVRVEFYADSRYPVDRTLVRTAVTELLGTYGMADQPLLVEVTLVGNRKMRELNRTHRHLDEPTDVLSFPLENQIAGPDGVIRLGDVIVSFPEARTMAVKMNRMVDQVITDLVLHGVKHLVGDHHD